MQTDGRTQIPHDLIPIDSLLLALGRLDEDGRIMTAKPVVPNLWLMRTGFHISDLSHNSLSRNQGLSEETRHRGTDEIGPAL